MFPILIISIRPASGNPTFRNYLFAVATISETNYGKNCWRHGNQTNHSNSERPCTTTHKIRKSCEFCNPYCVLSCLVLSCPVLSCPVLSCLVLSCLVLSCLVLSCPVLSCPVLSCPVLSCPVLSCLCVHLPFCFPHRGLGSYVHFSPRPCSST